MSDDRKRFMFDALSDELYSLGEVARTSPPRPPAPPISIRIVEGQAPEPEPLTLGDFKAAVDTLATASIPTSSTGHYSVSVSPHAAVELVISQVWIDPLDYPSRRAWLRAMAPVFKPGFKVPGLGWGLNEQARKTLTARMSRGWQRVIRRRRRALKARRGW